MKKNISRVRRSETCSSCLSAVPSYRKFVIPQELSSDGSPFYELLPGVQGVAVSKVVTGGDRGELAVSCVVSLKDSTVPGLVPLLAVHVFCLVLL